jgi:hypothetical protein
LGSLDCVSPLALEIQSDVNRMVPAHLRVGSLDVMGGQEKVFYLGDCPYCKSLDGSGPDGLRIGQMLD